MIRDDQKQAWFIFVQESKMPPIGGNQIKEDHWVIHAIDFPFWHTLNWVWHIHTAHCPPFCCRISKQVWYVHSSLVPGYAVPLLVVGHPLVLNKNSLHKIHVDRLPLKSGKIQFSIVGNHVYLDRPGVKVRFASSIFHLNWILSTNSLICDKKDQDKYFRCGWKFFHSYVSVRAAGTADDRARYFRETVPWLTLFVNVSLIQ
jgi:hypothetical protein